MDEDDNGKLRPERVKTHNSVTANKIGIQEHPAVSARKSTSLLIYPVTFTLRHFSDRHFDQFHIQACIHHFFLNWLMILFSASFCNILPFFVFSSICFSFARSIVCWLIRSFARFRHKFKPCHQRSFIMKFYCQNTLAS